MPLLTAETEVFSSATTTDRCAVMFIARRQLEPGETDEAERQGIAAVLSELDEEGWILSIRAMFGPTAERRPFALDTGFAHGADLAGVFEAPSLSAALAGTVRLEQAGWARLFITEWLIGPREFAPVRGAGGEIDRPWGFLALWEWNDGWAEASPSARIDYDAECDVAFKGDLSLGVNIAGRHRFDWAHGWHHLGIWEAADPGVIDRAIAGHEHAADFMFTTSRHIIGRVTPLLDLIAAKDIAS